MLRALKRVRTTWSIVHKTKADRVLAAGFSVVAIWKPLMRCIFCKKPSSSSRSIEHIIPESLGNKRHILPKGIVCDVCNNYFSRKVEKPFLDLPAVRNLRFQQDLESKRGKVPSIPGLISPDIPALLTRYPKYNLTSIEISEPNIERLIKARQGTMVIPLAAELPNTPVVSRFLAKIALEAMALRLVEFPEGITYLCDEAQLDVLRDHARKGYVTTWPINIRTIYHQDGKTSGSSGNSEQIVHEFDFLVTDQSERFFVIAIFGVEFAINLAGPDISGYRRWLEQTGGLSPLYTERHGGVAAMPR